MFNWCQNEVTIVCNDPEKLKHIEEKFASPNPFKAFVPRPQLLDYTVTGKKEFLIEGSRREYRNWYHNEETGEERPFTEEEILELARIGANDPHWWNIRNWGTNLDIPPQQADCLANDAIFYAFDTAWTPPIGIYKALIEMIGEDGDVNWFYREDGARIAGWLGEDSSYPLTQDPMETHVQ